MVKRFKEEAIVKIPKGAEQVGNGRGFERGRNVSAYIELVPRQLSTRF